MKSEIYKMKILQVCPYDFSRPGGVKSHVVSLSKYLTKLGHEVKIIAPNANTHLVSQSGIHFFGKSRSLNLGGTKIDVNIALGSEKDALKKFLKSENFDVIHYHTIWNPLLPFQIRKYSKAKQVATFHDTPKSTIIGKWIMPLMARSIFPFLDQIISVSKSQSKFIARLSKRKIHIIPNGIDLELLDQTIPKENTRKDDFFQLLFLGRLEPRKGVMHAVQAYKILKLRYPQMKLKIAGDGDGRSEVEQYIKDHSLTGIELLGFVDEKEKYRLLKESEIYLAPALYGESFGIVLLEAMATGIPIVGYANEGYKNVITAEMNEGFAEPGDLNKLVSCIETLIPSSVRNNLVKHGLKEVKKYDWEILSKQIEKKYK